MIIVGAKYISQLLNGTPTLQELDIGNNDIGKDWTAVVSRALQHNRSLTKLEIWKSRLSTKGTVVNKIQDVAVVGHKTFCEFYTI